MRDLPRESRRRIAGEPGARQIPELRQDVVLNECNILDLAVETRHEAELGLCASIRLALVEDLLGDLVLEGLGGSRLLEDLVLAEGEEAFEDVLADREAEDELLPWEAWWVKEYCKSLWIVSLKFERVIVLA